MVELDWTKLTPMTVKMILVDFSFYLFLQCVQRSFTGLNLLQHGLILHSREQPQAGVYWAHTGAILLLA